MNWNLRYAMEQKDFEQAWGGTPPSAEEALFIRTTSDPIQWDDDDVSFQHHRLDRPIGSFKDIYTYVDSTAMNSARPNGAYLARPNGAYVLENNDHPNKETELEHYANTVLRMHFKKKPIDLPNKVDLEHPDNHQHILDRVKSFLVKHNM